MSISGIGGGNIPALDRASILGPTTEGGVEASRPEPKGENPHPSRVGAQPSQAALRGRLPVEAPPGTDPELWSVLTTEERAYYARAQSLGPLTYGRSEVVSAHESIGLGGRLDLKV